MAGCWRGGPQARPAEPKVEGPDQTGSPKPRLPAPPEIHQADWRRCRTQSSTASRQCGQPPRIEITESRSLRSARPSGDRGLRPAVHAGAGKRRGLALPWLRLSDGGSVVIPNGAEIVTSPHQCGLSHRDKRRGSSSREAQATEPMRLPPRGSRAESPGGDQEDERSAAHR